MASTQAASLPEGSIIPYKRSFKVNKSPALNLAEVPI